MTSGNSHVFVSVIRVVNTELVAVRRQLFFTFLADLAVEVYKIADIITDQWRRVQLALSQALLGLSNLK